MKSSSPAHLHYNIDKSLGDIGWQGLPCILYTGKKLWLNSQLPALCVLCLNQPLQESPGFPFQPMDQDLLNPSRIAQLYPHSHLYWPIGLYEFGNLICIKLDQLGTWVGTCSKKGAPPSPPPLCLSWVHFCFLLEAAFPPVCKLFHLNKVSPFWIFLGILVYTSEKWFPQSYMDIQWQNRGSFYWCYSLFPLSYVRLKDWDEYSASF